VTTAPKEVNSVPLYAILIWAVLVNSPLVGVGVIVLKDGRVLLGERRGSHGAGTWALPGGHLDFGESVESCAKRETLEETGLALDRVALGPFSNEAFIVSGKHYVTLFVIAACPNGEPTVMEPHKCARWAWFPWDAMPAPLFTPLDRLRATGFHPRLSVAQESELES
jgi:8-oxo-dGTP diphosphatase